MLYFRGTVPFCPGKAQGSQTDGCATHEPSLGAAQETAHTGVLSLCYIAVTVSVRGTVCATPLELAVTVRW